MSKELIIVGASGHGKVIADIAEDNGYSNISFLDDDDSIKECNGYPVVGGSDAATKFVNSDFVVAIGNAAIRRKVQENLLLNGLHLATLIHSKATVSSSAKVGAGAVIMAGAVINACAKIGKGCIINTCASVDHDCTVGDYSHISVGSHLAGAVNIGENCWLGIGSVVSNNLTICDNCFIGAGAVVVKNLQESGTYIGIPAKEIKKRY